MPSNALGKCRSCGKPVLWVKMLKTGKKNPLDPEPVENGNVFAYDDPQGGTDILAEALTAEELAQKRDEGELLYLSHFATCESAKGWRR